MLQKWILYLNRCVAVSAIYALKALGANVPFLLKPILAKFEEGHYIGLILPMQLTDWVSGGIRGSISGR